MEECESLVRDSIRVLQKLKWGRFPLTDMVIERGLMLMEWDEALGIIEKQNKNAW